MYMSLNKLWEAVKDREAWGATVLGSQRVTEGGLSELSILLAAQQVKVTLYFVYF